MALWQMDIVGGVYVASPRGEPVEAKVVTGVDDDSRYCVIAAVVPRASGRRCVWRWCGHVLEQSRQVCLGPGQGPCRRHGLQERGDSARPRVIRSPGLLACSVAVVEERLSQLPPSIAKQAAVSMDVEGRSHGYSMATIFDARPRLGLNSSFVGLPGLEPGTNGLKVRCSNPLS